MTDQTTDHLSQAVEAVTKRQAEVACGCLSAKEIVEAAEPFLATYYEDKFRARWAHGGEPDISPGDVIAAEPDGTIVLDDGITSWNPTRATAFLVAAAEEKGRSGERERLIRVWTRVMADPGNFVRRVSINRELDHEDGMEPLIDWQLRALLASLDSDQEGDDA